MSTFTLSNDFDPGGGDEFSTPTGPKRLYSQVSPQNTPKENKRLRDSVSIDDSSTSECELDYCVLVSQASDILAKINDIINDSRVTNPVKTGIMQYTQQVTGIVSKLAIKSASNELKLSKMEKELSDIRSRQLTSSSQINNEQSNSNSYANQVKLRLSKTNTTELKPQPQAPCVVAYPTSERSADYPTSSATKLALMKAIKPSDDGFQIVGVKKAAKSGVVLRVANETQLKKLQSSSAIKSAGLRLEKPKGRRPRILVKDVPGSMDESAFVTTLYRQNIKDELNITEEEFIKSTKITRRRKLDNGRKWIGLEIDLAIRHHLVNTKSKLFIDWATCRFVDDVELVRCLKCQQFGHVFKYCTNKTPACANCAGEHDTRLCPNKEAPDFIPTCIACKRFNKPCNHRCGSNECSTYKHKLEQLLLNTYSINNING